MSNTSYSGRRSSDSAENAAIREMVAQRAGRDWCLFLDRDGVINRRIVGDYVRCWGQFEFLPNAPQALMTLRQWAPHLVVVTNQQGIGKGLMTGAEVMAIHERLQAELARDGVTIDAFTVCPHLDAARCPCRKPSPGLVLDWLGRHPHCDPLLSVVVGDSVRDLELAHNVAAAAGACASIHIGGADPGGMADASFAALWDFAIAVRDARGEQGR